jgi:hypothetical protein
MKKTVFVFYFLLVFSILRVLSQNIFIGFPLSGHSIKDGDMVLLNPLPMNPHGKFDSTMFLYYKSIIDFCTNNSDYQLNIYINIYQNDSCYSYLYSEFQKKRLIEYFIINDSTFYKTFILDIIPKGKSEPLIASKPPEMDYQTFMYLNSRIEIKFIRRNKHD